MSKSKLLEGYSAEAEVAQELGVSTRTLRAWRQRRVGPAWTELGRRIYYRNECIPAFLKAMEKNPLRSAKGRD